MPTPEYRFFRPFVKKEHQSPKRKDLEKLIRTVSQYCSFAKDIDDLGVYHFFNDADHNRTIHAGGAELFSSLTISTRPYNTGGEYIGYETDYFIRIKPAPSIVKSTYSGSQTENLLEALAATEEEESKRESALELEVQMGLREVNRREVLDLTKAFKKVVKRKYLIRRFIPKGGP